MHLSFTEAGWNEYFDWETEDPKTIKRINILIKDIEREGYRGVGKPEPLKGEYRGWWSRRIDEKNRIVYRLQGKDTVEIAHCKGHYGDH